MFLGRHFILFRKAVGNANGFNNYDEIGVVSHGFNSGSQAVMQPLLRNCGDTGSSTLRVKLVLFLAPIILTL
jgi:hypothetical protein